MQKEVYADNVDVNGEVHETVGENIRNGAKSPEAIAKALQSDEITFDMQALMNVLPFMDSSKVIRTIKVQNGELIEGGDVCYIDTTNNRIVPLKRWYGTLFGHAGGIARVLTILIENRNGGGLTVQLGSFQSMDIVLYVCVDK